MSYLNDFWVSKEEKIQSNKSKGYDKLLKIMWLLHIQVVLGVSNGGKDNFQTRNEQRLLSLVDIAI